MIKGYRIVKFEDIQDELTDYHTHGARPGYYLGFNSMEDYYSMRPDGVTDWTGLPQSGKTELLLECLFNTSVFYDWKHLLCVPDIGSYIEVLAILIHKYTGKTFEKRYKNVIELKDAFNACPWLLDHFHILDKVDPRAPILTPVEFWNFACEYKEEHKIQTATIDSWKDMRHDYAAYGGTYAQYLSQVLPLRNALSEKHKIHFHTVIHPKTPRRGKNHDIIHPDVDDMEGGAQWNNSGKTIISVHRASYDTKNADIKILKAKPKAVGKRGAFILNFDPVLSRYFEILDRNDGGSRHYAKAKEIIKEQKALPMQQGIDFLKAENKADETVTTKKWDEEDLPF